MARASRFLESQTGPIVGLTVAVGVVLAVFLGKGGNQLPGATAIELIALGVGTATVAAAILTGAWPSRFGGGAVLLAFVLLFGLTAASITWSAGGEESWLESSRVLSYLAIFAAGAAAASLAPTRLEWVLRGLLAGFVIVAGYALASKVFPGALAHSEIYARLRAPFDYWNAAGLAAAYGVLLSLWWGVRRDAHPVAAIAAPALMVMFATTLLISYSRGSLLALAIGLIVWFVAVPLRIRSAGMLVLTAAATAPVVAWAFSQNAFSENRLDLQVRSHTGSEFWVYLLLAMVVVSGVAAFVHLRGFSIPPRRRRKVGRVLIGGLVAGVLAVLVGAAAASGGPTELVSKGWHDLTSPKVHTPANTPGRLTSASNARTRYWRDAARIFDDHRWFGVGAGAYEIVRPRYRHDLLEVRHAHGFVPQMAADLGIAGLAVTLLLLAVFLAALVRALRVPPPESGNEISGWSSERVAQWALAVFVITFGVHSAIDWTWFVPGVALPALFGAGWLVAVPQVNRARERGGFADPPPWPARGLAAGLLVFVGVVGALTIVQPLRASNRADDALALAADGHYAAARDKLRQARDIDPLAIETFFDLASVEAAAGQKAAGRRALQQAVRQNPANPDAWLKLAQYQLGVLKQPAGAINTLSAAAFLNPKSAVVQSVYVEALKQEAAQKARQQAAAQAPAPAAGQLPAGGQVATP